MTYFGFLVIFLLLPLIILLWLTWWDYRRGCLLPHYLDTWPVWGAVLLHVFIAVIYTTPWDNYLVATGVWYYDPQRVTGVTLGWVPIEEYTFFVLQSLLTGTWLLYLSRRVQILDLPLPHRPGLRIGIVAFLGSGVLASVVLLVSGYAPGTYLALILIWALPPIMIQIGWGGHILWQYRRLVFTALISSTLYLAGADWMAIGSGIWEIDPGQSFNLFILKALPIEELIFFLVTNTLLVFGVTLALARPSLEQFVDLRQRFAQTRIKDRIPTSVDTTPPGLH